MSLETQHIAIKLLLGGKAQNIEGILSVEELLVVIDGVDLGLTLGDIDVVVDVTGDEALSTEATLTDVVSVGLEQLVEDMVGHNVTTAKLSGCGEVDTDELSEPGGVVVPGSLGVTVGLQDWVGCHNLVLKRNLLGVLLGSAASSR